MPVSSLRMKLKYSVDSANRRPAGVLGEFGGGQRAGVDDQQRGEHPGWHPRDAGLHQHGREPLHEPRHRRRVPAILARPARRCSRCHVTPNAAVAVLAFGLRPGWSMACGWGALAVAGLLVLFGPALSLSHWLVDVSPFAHLPKLPGEPVSAPPLAWLCVAALAIGAAGLAGLRRRDIA
jgi:hypothetical protein